MFHSVYTLPLIAGFCVVASITFPWVGTLLASKYYDFEYDRLAFIGGWMLIIIGAFATAVPFVLGIVKQGDGYVAWLAIYAVGLLVSWYYLIVNQTDFFN